MVDGVTEKLKNLNEHLSVEQMLAHLRQDKCDWTTEFGANLEVELLGRLKPLDDCTTKFLVRANSGDAAAVIVCSRATAPGLVARGTALAQSTQDVLGKELGEPIITPIGSGCIEGRSYVVLPVCREFSQWKPMRVIQRIRLRRPLLDWLHDATSFAASRLGPPVDEESSFRSMLQYLKSRDFLSSAQLQATSEAICRIESGDWQPRHTFDHNDLWLGNVMLPGNSHHGSGSKYPFVLIDWAGANPHGYGIYDLIRIARSLKLSSVALRRELNAHSEALQCELCDTAGHLLAAFGRLHRHLECWPEARFLQSFNNCWGLFEQAIKPN